MHLLEQDLQGLLVEELGLTTHARLPLSCSAIPHEGEVRRRSHVRRNAPAPAKRFEPIHDAGENFPPASESHPGFHFRVVAAGNRAIFGPMELHKSTTRNTYFS